MLIRMDCIKRPRSTEEKKEQRPLSRGRDGENHCWLLGSSSGMSVAAVLNSECSFGSSETPGACECMHGYRCGTKRSKSVENRGLFFSCPRSRLDFNFLQRPTTKYLFRTRKKCIGRVIERDMSNGGK